MQVINTVLAPLGVLCVLIFVHELGHFLLAKFHKVGVLAFSIGFGPILWKRTIGETTYSLRLLPLGGFVRMVGDDPRMLNMPPSVLSDPKAVEDSENSPLEAIDLEPMQVRLFEDKSRWFLLKGFWPKFWIVFAGPAFNIIFAFLIAISSLAIFGRSINEPVIGGVMEGLPAEAAGLKTLDRVLAIDGTAIATWDDLAEAVRHSGGRKLTLRIESTLADKGVGGEIRDLTVTPELDPLISEDSPEDQKIYRLGIKGSPNREPVPFGEAVRDGSLWVANMTVGIAWSLKELFSGNVSPKHISGPIGIMKEVKRSADEGPVSLVAFMIFLSVSLAILNLLPIPVLDGGHIVFFVIEALKGGPLTVRFREVANGVGMFLLLALMIFAIGNDLLGIFSKSFNL